MGICIGICKSCWGKVIATPPDSVTGETPVPTCEKCGRAPMIQTHGGVGRHLTPAGAVEEWQAVSGLKAPAEPAPT